MKLLFIRHGETDWNLALKLQGITDNSLNETGLKQAYEAKTKLANIHIDIIIASPLKRAYATAEIIRGDLDIPIITDERIAERSFGNLEGAHISKLEEHGMVDWGYSKSVPPNGESDDDIIVRVNNFLNDVKDKYKNKTVLVASHGGVWKCIDWYFNGMPKQGEPWREIDNAQIKEYEL